MKKNMTKKILYYLKLLNLKNLTSHLSGKIPKWAIITIIAAIILVRILAGLSKVYFH